MYEVIVGNIGLVHTGNNRKHALSCYVAYVSKSQHGIGRAANEPVTLLCDDEIVREYNPPVEEE